MTILRFLEKQKESEYVLSWKVHREKNETGEIGRQQEIQGALCKLWLEFRYHSKCVEKLSKGFEQVSSMISLYFKFIFLLPCRE